ncbi:hypothetical protein [Mycolicibacterium hodleri]|uniref:Uncharacterized protein n=1 Tax=Mycolicibacterium hodleri TaxID=49897 RepID=A0A502E7G1_9MYCO|nr:hypothetical protein [Mycolicibacterium hodleri]TPG33675.1 hypothetical protein EAH80_15585 [Mycolicibacterium hodleri]
MVASPMMKATLLVAGGAERVVEAAAPWAGVIAFREMSLPEELLFGSGGRWCDPTAMWPRRDAPATPTAFLDGFVVG